MKYISTRGGIEPVGFLDAVSMGLARDGGLLLPASIPNVADRLEAWKRLSYVDLAMEIMRLYCDLPEDDLRKLVRKSYSTFDAAEITPVEKVNGVYVLELFHGPTLAFKDLALQFLGNLFEYMLTRSGGEMNIVAATSGDTGSAAIYGVKGREHIRIFVMHPHGRVSAIQEKQMTSVLDANVFNIAVDGTFDDCQKIMKELFNDLAFKDRRSLATVNSINWARVLAQIVYYFYAAFRVMEKTSAKSVRFAVPTGNFGDIFAGYIAARMGLPVGRLVLATNENDILARFFNSDDYSVGKVCATISPSMDIQVASNFERYLYYRLGEDAAALNDVMRKFSSSGRLSIGAIDRSALKEIIVAGSATTRTTMDTIRRFYGDHGYLFDPHTAVGVFVGLNNLHVDEPMICLATAHPAKFGKAIEDSVGSDVAHHPFLDRLNDLPTRCDVLPPSTERIREYIDKKIGAA